MMFKGFFEAVGLALIILTLAVSCEYCARSNKELGPYQWFMGPQPRP